MKDTLFLSLLITLYLAPLCLRSNGETKVLLPSEFNAPSKSSSEIESVNITGNSSHGNGEKRVIHFTVITVLTKPAGMSDAKFQELVSKMRARQLSVDEQRNLWKRIVAWWKRFLQKVRSTASRLMDLLKGNQKPDISSSKDVGLSEDAFKRRSIPIESTDKKKQDATTPSQVSPDSTDVDVTSSTIGIDENTTIFNVTQTNGFNVTSIEGYNSSVTSTDAHNDTIDSSSLHQVHFDEKDIDQNEVKEYTEKKHKENQFNFKVKDFDLSSSV